jgi:general secretion pathway protein D
MITGRSAGILRCVLGTCGCLAMCTPALAQAEAFTWTDILEEESHVLRAQAQAIRPSGEDQAGGRRPVADAGPEHGGRRSVRAELLQAVDQAWRTPQRAESVARPDILDTAPMLPARLGRIRIPRVELSGLPLSRALEMLGRLSEEHDPERQGVNLVLVDPGGRDPGLHLTLRGLTLDRILELTVESVGYELEPTADAVLVRPAESGGRRLETEFYPLPRATLIRLVGWGGGGSDVLPPADPFAAAEPGGDTVDSAAGSRRQEDALRAFLQRAGVPFQGVEGATLALAEGQLIVTQTPRNLARVRNILRRYRDIQQVTIETRFIEVQEKNMQELGFGWSITAGGRPAFDARGMPVLDEMGRQALTGRDQYGNMPLRTLADAFTAGQESSRLFIDRPGFEMPQIPQGAPALPGSVELGGDGSPLARISGVIGRNEVQLMLRALERQTGNDLLSAPRVTVLSGKTAEIVVAQEFRYPEMYGDMAAEVGRGDSTAGSAGVAITAGTPRDFAVRNIGVEMRVTPTVEQDRAISLRLEPVVTELEGFVEYGGTSVAIASDTTVTVPSGFYQPVFSVRRVRTEVTIWDGATVVMGGLTREQAVKIRDKVPILGDIPLLGRLFRSEGESVQKRNLLIFVTASLVGPGGARTDYDDHPSSH